MKYGFSVFGSQILGLNFRFHYNRQFSDEQGFNSNSLFHFSCRLCIKLVLSHRKKFTNGLSKLNRSQGKLNSRLRAHSKEVTFVSNNTQFMSLPLVRASRVSILRSPLVKKKLQGSILKGWVSFILIRKLKHAENGDKNHSKT